MARLFCFSLLFLLAFTSFSNAQPILNHYPVPRPMLSKVMSLSEEWQALRGQSVISDREAAAIILNKCSYIETHVFDLYTMLTMEEDHARNSNLSRYACEALITNINLFKEQLNMEIDSFKLYAQKQNNPELQATLKEFGALLERTKKLIVQIEAETKKNYLKLDV